MSDKNYLTGKLLLAMPALGDPRFHHAVILICAHDESGAMGLVINQPMPDVNFEELASQTDITGKPQIDISVLCGGPVDPARGFILHSPKAMIEDAIHVNDKYHVAGTLDALNMMAAGKGPKLFKFILGYAGWNAQQLDAEIQDNAWLVAEADEALVFSRDLDTMWQRALDTLGIDPAMLSGTAGRA